MMWQCYSVIYQISELAYGQQHKKYKIETHQFKYESHAMKELNIGMVRKYYSQTMLHLRC